MTITIQRPRRTAALRAGIVAAAVAALTLAGTAPAAAADVQLGPDDIAGFQNGDESSADYNYDLWHIASVYNSDASVGASLEFGECSVTTLAVPEGTAPGADVTQVLKGFPIQGRPTAGPTGTVDDLRALIDSISIDVAQGEVTLQLPVFLYVHGDSDDRQFTTFRNAQEFGPGVHTLEGQEIANSGSGGGWAWDFYGDNFEAILAELQADIVAHDDIFEILGVGFAGSPGAVINSISFAGDTYYFGTGACTPTQDDEDEDGLGVADDELIAPRPPERVDTGR